MRCYPKSSSYVVTDMESLQDNLMKIQDKEMEIRAKKLELEGDIANDPMKFRSVNMRIDSQELLWLDRAWRNKSHMRFDEVQRRREDYAKQRPQPPGPKQLLVEEVYWRHCAEPPRHTPEWCREIVRHKAHFHSTVVIIPGELGDKLHYGVLHRHGSPHQVDLVLLTPTPNNGTHITEQMRKDMNHIGWFQSYRRNFTYNARDVFDEFDIGTRDQTTMQVFSIPLAQ